MIYTLLTNATLFIHTYICVCVFCLYIINIHLYKIQELQELDFSKALTFKLFPVLEAV